jgi:hypothetical protein
VCERDRQTDREEGREKRGKNEWNMTGRDVERYRLREGQRGEGV